MRYLWDLALDLVSCMAMIAGVVWKWWIRLWMLGRDVFREATFHVIICVSWCVCEE